MKPKKIPCFKCNIALKPVFITHMGIRLEALKCPKCKQSVFTESLATTAVRQLEARRLSLEYKKHPIKIGNSWGFIFPKEVTEVFGLNNSKLNLKIHPNLAKKKIEILLP